MSLTVISLTSFPQNGWSPLVLGLPSFIWIWNKHSQFDSFCKWHWLFQAIQFVQIHPNKSASESLLKYLIFLHFLLTLFNILIILKIILITGSAAFSSISQLLSSCTLPLALVKSQGSTWLNVSVERRSVSEVTGLLRDSA